MWPASFYTAREDGKVQCELCPQKCILSPGQYGVCNVRYNRGGELRSENYGVLSSISTDPVEKKPLYHFHPGRSILSIGSFGCNLSCDFCQNCEISQIDPHILSHHPAREPDDIVNKARLHRDNIGLAYTYNEPTIYFEYMLRCASLAREQNLDNVMVTNGFINREPLEALLPYMDAFNVDLKAFTEAFYRRRSSARLGPVLDTIRTIRSSDSHLEITFLIIPGQNDNPGEWREMIDWIEDNCGNESVLHVSRYFPRFKLNEPPTPIETIRRFLDLARKKINYVYPGNAPSLDNNTYCPSCGSLLIERHMYRTVVGGMSGTGNCSQCGYGIYGRF